MSVVLSPDVERQIDELVKSGRFASADEVIRKGLELFRRAEALNRERLADLQGRREEIERLLAEAEDDVRNGRVTVYDRDGLKALAAEIKAAGRQRREVPAEQP
jgi:putative addiction module CopG family antidote